MLDLSGNQDKGYVSLSEIAKRQGLSLKYLEQTAIVLKNVGYINSKKGQFGGYKLLKEPCDYTVGMVLKLSEENLYPSSCSDCESKICDCDEICSVMKLRKKLDVSVDKVLDSCTLADMVKWSENA